MIKKNSKIFLAGHKGMVGSAILRKLKEKKYSKVITIEKSKLNLLNQLKVENFLKKIKPKIVIIAAARVGGILANNQFKANFIYENLMIQNNLIHGSYKAGVKKLVFLGSSCVYPKNCSQPMKEEYLLTGKLEETNDAYSIAKIAGMKMCETYSNQYGLDYKSLMPPNMYGPNDNYHNQNSHFFASLLRKIMFARDNNKKDIILWGNGKAKRELLYVDDLADACLHFMKIKTREKIINIGNSKEKSIKEYAKFIMKKLKIDTKIIFDTKKPNGMPRKILNCNVAKKYGWKSKTDLSKGFDLTYNSFLQSKNKNI